MSIAYNFPMSNLKFSQRFFSRLRRVMAASLSMVYLTTQVVWGHASETNFWEQRRRHRPLTMAALPAAAPAATPLPAAAALSPTLPPVEPTLPPGLTAETSRRLTRLLQGLPANLGRVDRISLPRGSGQGPVILHIQDVHMHGEAQARIGQALDSLMRDQQISLVALEGVFRPIDLGRLRAFPDKEITLRVANHLLRENLISGAVHAMLTTPAQAPRLAGVDDKPLYDANVEAYRRAAPLAAARRKSLAAERVALAEQKADVFNPALLAFDREMAAYQESRRSPSDHVGFLTRTPVFSPNRFTATAIFQKALALEKSLNFSEVEAQRARLLQKMVPALGRTQTDALLRDSAAFRAGALTPGVFYGRLKSLCAAQGVPLRDYPAVDAYVRYVLAADDVNAGALFNELKQLEEAAYQLLSHTDQERALIRAGRLLALREKLVNFSLTPVEWGEYKSLKESSREMLATTDGSIYKDFEAFYEMAVRRDAALSENLLSSMAGRSAETAALVTGGFHAAGLERRLTDAGATVVTFIPKITQVDEGSANAALSVFLQKKAPLDTLFQGQELFVTPDPLQGAPRLPFLRSMLAYLSGGLTAARKSFTGEGQIQVAGRGNKIILTHNHQGVEVTVGVVTGDTPAGGRLPEIEKSEWGVKTSWIIRLKALSGLVVENSRTPWTRLLNLRNLRIRIRARWAPSLELAGTGLNLPAWRMPQLSIQTYWAMGQANGGPGEKSQITAVPGAVSPAPAAPPRAAPAALSGRDNAEREAQQKFASGELRSVVFIDGNLIANSNKLIGKPGVNILLNSLQANLLETLHASLNITWRHGGDEFVGVSGLTAEALLEPVTAFKNKVENTWFAVGSLGEQKPEESLEEAAEKQGGTISLVGRKYILTLPMGKNKDARQRLRRFLDSRTGRQRKLQKSWLDRGGIKNQIRLTLSIGIGDADEKNSEESRYSQTLELAAARKDQAKQDFKAQGDSAVINGGQPGIHHSHAAGSRAVKTQNPTHSFRGAEKVAAFEALNSDAKSLLMEVPWARGDVQYTAGRESFGLPKESPEGVLAFSLSVGGYRDVPRRRLRQGASLIEKALAGLLSAGQWDWRLATRELKAVNDSEWGYTAGDDLIGLLRYEVLKYPPLPGYRMIVVRGPPAGPLGILIPLESAPRIKSRKEIDKRLTRWVRNLEKKLERQSHIRVTRILLSVEEMEGQKTLGQALKNLDETRQVMERKYTRPRVRRVVRHSESVHRAALAQEEEDAWAAAAFRLKQSADWAASARRGAESLPPDKPEMHDEPNPSHGPSVSAKPSPHDTRGNMTGGLMWWVKDEFFPGISNKEYAEDIAPWFEFPALFLMAGAAMVLLAIFVPIDFEMSLRLAHRTAWGLFSLGHAVDVVRSRGGKNSWANLGVAALMSLSFWGAELLPGPVWAILPLADAVSLPFHYVVNKSLSRQSPLETSHGKSTGDEFIPQEKEGNAQPAQASPPLTPEEPLAFSRPTKWEVVSWETSDHHAHMYGWLSQGLNGNLSMSDVGESTLIHVDFHPDTQASFIEGVSDGTVIGRTLERHYVKEAWWLQTPGAPSDEYDRKFFKRAIADPQDLPVAPDLPVILSLDYDYFSCMEQPRVSERDVENRVQSLFESLQSKGYRIVGVFVARSPDYTRPEHFQLIENQITQVRHRQAAQQVIDLLKGDQSMELGQLLRLGRTVKDLSTPEGRQALADRLAEDGAEWSEKGVWERLLALVPVEVHGPLSEIWPMVRRERPENGDIVILREVWTAEQREKILAQVKADGTRPVFLLVENPDLLSEIQERYKGIRGVYVEPLAATTQAGENILQHEPSGVTLLVFKNLETFLLQHGSAATGRAFAALQGQGVNVLADNGLKPDFNNLSKESVFSNPLTVIALLDELLNIKIESAHLGLIDKIRRLIDQAA